MIVTALIFGLLGSFHCVGMCGPIAFLLPVDRKYPVKRMMQVGSYHLGRLFTYSFIGLLFGFVGKGLNLFGFQQQLSILIGVLMILVIIFPASFFRKYNLSKPIYAAVAKIKSALGGALRKKTADAFFTIGFLNGLLPCGLVYMAVFGALATGGAWQGSLYMMAFGIGTIPLMTSATYLGNFLTGKMKQRVLKVIPVFVVIIGLLFILRGLGLGIPYLSPPDKVSQPLVTSAQSCH
ncbi:sulfite exporter TauE/SafE family protein [Gillisia sp. M10.2A]|uniref:Sulfite exporter TauE/SafE family protein n=1 Tax=Gillisia lutea TaxID=2909668 RepID=A0ABS9EEW5_9FLAO|nr:sulfite exporter TauE/SafE family protein [Gillisia lutea]MCF4101402.1 sulfite exporter TauE/SafE family protein [Gillisia lutea]